jgi:dihydropyrimidinase
MSCTPWEGHVDGAFHGDLKHGQFLNRKVDDEIRSRPAV